MSQKSEHPDRKLLTVLLEMFLNLLRTRNLTVRLRHLGKIRSDTIYRSINAFRSNKMKTSEKAIGGYMYEINRPITKVDS